MFTSTPITPSVLQLVLLHILIMNILNNCCILLMIMCGGMKITALEESADFATLDKEKLFSKLKSHELSHKGRPNHDASFTSKALITSAHVGVHDANPTNTISSSLKFALSSLVVASDEQYESSSDNEIALLVRKFQAMHKFWKDRKRNP
jgi:hypothetical protein